MANPPEDKVRFYKIEADDWRVVEIVLGILDSVWVEIRVRRSIEWRGKKNPIPLPGAVTAVLTVLAVEADEVKEMIEATINLYHGGQLKITEIENPNPGSQSRF